VELDGAAAHSGWAAIKRDRERELALRANGFPVVRYSWEQVTARAGRVVADLHGLLGPWSRFFHCGVDLERSSASS
jgi:very-short-patch-repair endonuclease